MFKCVICADGMLPVENVESTICGHLFHQKCIKQWIKSNSSCPQCRKKFDLKKKFIKVLHHRVFLPDQITNKSDLQEKIEELTLKAQMLEKEKVEIEKKLKIKSKEVKNMLNKRKRMMEELEDKKQRKRNRIMVSCHFQPSVLIERLKLLQPKTPISDYQLKRNLRVKAYYKRKKEIRRQELRQAAAEANLEQAANLEQD